MLISARRSEYMSEGSRKSEWGGSLGGSDWIMLNHEQAMLKFSMLAQSYSYKLVECHPCILNLFTAFILRLDALR